MSFTTHLFVNLFTILVIFAAAIFMILNRKDKDRKQAFLLGFIIIVGVIATRVIIDYEDKHVSGLLIEGVACETDSDCLRGNCAPTWSEQRYCAGRIKADEVAEQPSQCESGVFLTGTSICAPSQFKICVRNPNEKVYVWTVGNQLSGVFLAGSDGCWISDPSRNHRLATVKGSDLRECRQYTRWAERGVPCEVGSGVFAAAWYKGML